MAPLQRQVVPAFCSCPQAQLAAAEQEIQRAKEAQVGAGGGAASIHELSRVCFAAPTPQALPVDCATAHLNPHALCCRPRRRSRRWMRCGSSWLRSRRRCSSGRRPRRPPPPPRRARRPRRRPPPSAARCSASCRPCRLRQRRRGSAPPQPQQTPRRGRRRRRRRRRRWRRSVRSWCSSGRRRRRRSSGLSCSKRITRCGAA